MMVEVSWAITVVVLGQVFFLCVINLMCSRHRMAVIKALTGLWADYDHVPYQLATDEFEDMQEGLLVQYDEKNTTHVVYQLDRQAAEDWFDAI